MLNKGTKTAIGCCLALIYMCQFQEENLPLPAWQGAVGENADFGFQEALKKQLQSNKIALMLNSKKKTKR